jgi:16S rRNA pseudouridine516 synthase
MRIDKFLSNLKYGTRTEIRDLVSSGRVLRKGILVTDSGMDIDPEGDLIAVDGETVFYKKNIYLMMNKPQGILSANKDARYKTVIDLVIEPYSRFDLDLCGRLDLDTEGFVLLTNDGEMLHQITNPKKDVEKIYQVTLARPLGDHSRLLKGVKILDGKDQPYVTKPARIIPQTPTTCQIAITEGKFHQVKRMFEALGNQVSFLKRVSIGGLFLDPALKPGECKELSFSEVQAVFR